ncbi:bifunctional phosphopantothenoylcysteine decarboxylase/phosphopantothenate--cysteine ligase CoaBC [Chitinophaga horti]|uniref:Coenzyme A biosynthesis bifunctional protein CoaBC n=1 Tax=Chitinophaga horti TaxID=2920382 RepID=A0ABY6J1B2_9BACT|nr:bifunctional phosphopantothenoylcysteine decarboxylase/phosphopantothenate--cysteine ligase CoaBC [Chitinophaga horti]UYQ93484.1 bifunctional phosphopantothenoylcysteine decarboxylase/phosphopantothenate--cysteine ligase CoaBC [Chitinophaga horti]
MLQGKKILLGVSGSIAAYKSAILVRLLVKAGAEVKVVMTPDAANFITPLTLSTLSKNEVGTAISEGSSWSNHVMMGRWADVMLVAPASANTIAKMANGLCDNLLLAVYLSATCPVFFAPAMDEDMWHHPATKANVTKLLGYGHRQLPVNKGELASGLFGEGRMSEPENIVAFLEEHFAGTVATGSDLPAAVDGDDDEDDDTPGDTGERDEIAEMAYNQAVELKSLAGQTVLVSAGPTVEQIDPVRFISNHSTGKMGIAIANALENVGASVILVLGPTHLKVSNPFVKVIPVRSADEMLQQCLNFFPKANIAIMSAAVADYRPAKVASDKIKKDEEVLTLKLEKTTDILKTLGSKKRDDQLLIGFALETNNEKEFALKKLKTKNLDMVVLNSLRDAGAGFGHDTNKVLLLDKYGGEQEYPLKSKQEVAKDIVQAIIGLQNA